MIFINQQAYIKSIIKRFRLTNARTITTPMEPGVVLVKEQHPELSKRSMGWTTYHMVKPSEVYYGQQ